MVLVTSQKVLTESSLPKMISQNPLTFDSPKLNEAVDELLNTMNWYEKNYKIEFHDGLHTDKKITNTGNIGATYDILTDTYTAFLIDVDGSSISLGKQYNLGDKKIIELANKNATPANAVRHSKLERGGKSRKKKTKISQHNKITILTPISLKKKIEMF